jgi:hypothetical protein
MAVTDIPVRELVGCDPSCSHCLAAFVLSGLLYENVLHDLGEQG